MFLPGFDDTVAAPCLEFAVGAACAGETVILAIVADFIGIIDEAVTTFGDGAAV